MKQNDLLDAELSETPSEALRGVRAPARVAPVVAIALSAALSTCDAGATAPDAPPPVDACICLADVPTGSADSGPLVYDAGSYVPDTGDEGP